MCSASLCSDSGVYHFLSLKASLQNRPSHWSWSAGQWLLNMRHTEDFWNASLRPYIKSLLRVLACSMDVQWRSSSNIHLRCVVGFAHKIDEGCGKEWLHRVPDALSAVLHMLRCWHPSECQMVVSNTMFIYIYTCYRCVHP